ncbi:MAG TPA: FliA/WhiG family RNA polymerase sigma factor [Solirubrobacteraceae bacterium]|jgi:RNA polymerase sigma factor for flagellar operon FliA|nr:FliA/WhiG family RNA polymerase sigma factor [Solirubrobacteraceae bacterium]
MHIKEQGAARASASEVLSLWLRYQRTGDSRLRDRLVFIFMPMVRYIVYRKVREVPAQCEVEDFLSCGLEALLRSIDRYDPDKGATLEQFAWTRIHGAVLDELRRHDWAPRSLRRSERAINGAREQFVSAHDRQPTREELASTLGMNPAQLSQRMDEIALVEVASLNKTVRAEDATTIERIDTLQSTDEEADPDLCAERREAKERFRRAFAQLPARERQVAVLLYVEGRTLRDIGARLGVSESRVSQIHTELRRRLREQLADDASLFSAV